MAQIFVSTVAHFFVSASGSKFHERMAHFFIDIYIAAPKELGKIENALDKTVYLL